MNKDAKNNIINGNSVVIVTNEAIEGKVYIAIFMPIRNIVAKAMDMVCGLKGKIEHTIHSEVQNIVFVPMYDTGDGKSFSEWCSNHNREEDTESILAYCTERISSGENDTAWKRTFMPKSVYTGSFLFQRCGYDTFSTHEPLHFEMRLEQESIEAAKTGLSSHFGLSKEDIFLSGQIIKITDILKNWLEFVDQAEMKLIEQQGFIRHLYDVQTFSENELIIPLFAIPTGVMKQWDATVSISDYQEFMQRFFDENGYGFDISSLIKKSAPDAMAVSENIFDYTTCKAVLSSWFAVQKMMQEKYIKEDEEPEKGGKGFWEKIKQKIFRKA